MRSFRSEFHRIDCLSNLLAWKMRHQLKLLRLHRNVASTIAAARGRHAQSAQCCEASPVPEAASEAVNQSVDDLIETMFGSRPAAPLARSSESNSSPSAVLSGHSCKNCGKPLKPAPTVNCEYRHEVTGMISLFQRRRALCIAVIAICSTAPLAVTRRVRSSTYSRARRLSSDTRRIPWRYVGSERRFHTFERMAPHAIMLLIPPALDRKIPRSIRGGAKGCEGDALCWHLPTLPTSGKQCRAETARLGRRLPATVRAAPDATTGWIHGCHRAHGLQSS